MSGVGSERVLPGQREEAPPFHLPPWFLGGGFFLLAAGACLDFHFLGQPVQLIHRHFAFAWVALLCVSDREGLWAKRVGLVLGGLFLALLLMPLLRGLAPHALPGRQDVLSLLFAGPLLLPWIAALFLAVPLLFEGEKSPPPALKLFVLFLLLYGLWVLAGIPASSNLRWSLRDYYRNFGLYLPVLIAFCRWGWRGPLSRLAPWILGWMTLLALAALLVVLTVKIGGVGWWEKLEQAGFIFVSQSNFQDIPQWRLTFPFLNFNRAGAFFLMAGGLFFLTAWKTGLSRKKQILLWGLTVLCLLLCYWTATRSALALLFLALLGWGALRSWKFALALTMLVLLGGVLMPKANRTHYLKIFQPSTYRTEAWENYSSMTLRFKGWQTGALMLKEVPWTGLGYGHNVTRRAYTDYARFSGDWEHKVHLHNVWLELAVESGIPAALFFLAWQLVRWFALARWAWLDRKQRAYILGWWALEGALFGFGILFFMLRRNFGLLHWGVWTWAFLVALRATQSLPDPNRKQSNP